MLGLESRSIVVAAWEQLLFGAPGSLTASLALFFKKADRQVDPLLSVPCPEWHHSLRYSVFGNQRLSVLATETENMNSKKEKAFGSGDPQIDPACPPSCI